MPTEPEIPRCRLMLVLPPTLSVADAIACMGAGDVAAVIVTTPAGDEAAAKAQLSELCAATQAAGVAFLLADRVELASDIGADGVHLGSYAALKRALPAVKPGGIAGIGLEGRHEAMEAGEAGADYVLFGARDGSGPIEPVIELVSWWAEVFEVPCVGVATTVEDARAIAVAGADFVALAAVPAGPDGPALVADVERTVAAVDRTVADATPKA
ncbi:thiamine phosphate synthase [Azorhizobium caulinodans]|uniref:thiamine phosphate synthase n=1 Tax=Azorhizobium caulinodans TaxID=7 RepID=UPI002FBD9A51